MGVTVGNVRQYTCKRCGADTEESLYKWRKKHQNVKNVCPACIKKRKLERETAIERAEDRGYCSFYKI